MFRLRAATVYPVTAPPIPDGAVLVDGDRVAAVGPDHAIPHPPEATPLDFPDAVLVPGLVNTHTHLELSHVAGRNPESGFVPWIRRIREIKDATPPAEFQRSAELGVRDAWARGITTVADTGSSGAVFAALVRLGGRGVAYHEVFGPDPARAEAMQADLAAAVGRLRRLASDRVRLGVSPHAPYTVSDRLYRMVAEYARRESLPLAVHVAESPEETALVRDGAGPFADALVARGIGVQARGISPVAHLAGLGVLSPDSLCIHCVHVDAADIARLTDAGAAVAHCPRSNAAHGHGRAPVAAMRAAGLRVGLGTDSVVSVADLDLWAEAAAAGFAGEAALRAVTLDGARALGLETEIGSIERGRAADLAVLPRLGHGAALFTTVAGRVVHRV
jgi:5-methylthioadenosine/S-adenosylhomocysteine deaminase